MPLSLKLMEVQIKGDQWNTIFRTVQVYWIWSPLSLKLFTVWLDLVFWVMVIDSWMELNEDRHDAPGWRNFVCSQVSEWLVHVCSFMFFSIMFLLKLHDLSF